MEGRPTLSTMTVEGSPRAARFRTGECRPAPAAARVSLRRHALFAHTGPRFGATLVLNNRGGIRLLLGSLPPRKTRFHPFSQRFLICAQH